MNILRISALTTVLAAAAFSAAQTHSRYGGPVYSGNPALKVTASLVMAGGGPEHYSAAKAFTSMLGAELTQVEVTKLTKQYGAEAVGNWLKVSDYSVMDALKRATAAGVKLPKGDLRGKKLAETLVKAGLDDNGTFYYELLLDKALTHGIHADVMDDIDAKFGEKLDEDYHRITNQAVYDIAMALKVKGVKLAQLH